MDFSEGDLGSTVLAALVFLVVAALVLGFGVWLGMVAIAPRIMRRQDRAEQEREEPGDRPD